MSVSEKQFKANQENAQKSTGPKTAAGKAVASMNAVKHGLYARNIVINSPNLKESISEYLQLLDSLIDDLKPVGALEQSLVHKIADCLWRSRRIINAETAQINRQLDDVDCDIKFHKSSMKFLSDKNCIINTENGEEIIRSVFAALKSIPVDNDSQQMILYEMRLDRQFARLYRILAHHQAIRKADSEKK